MTTDTRAVDVGDDAPIDRLIDEWVEIDAQLEDLQAMSREKTRGDGRVAHPGNDDVRARYLKEARQACGECRRTLESLAKYQPVRDLPASTTRIDECLDALWSIYDDLQAVYIDCKQRADGEVRDVSREKTRAKWYRENRQACAERRRVLEDIIKHRATEELEQLSQEYDLDL